MKKLIITLFAATFLFIGTEQTSAQTAHTVVSGDTFYKLGQAYGVSVNQIKQANHKTTNLLLIGERLTIPSSSVSAADKDLLARLVRAEAEGEPYAGKVAVATVVLNRVAHKDFPNSIRSVIEQVTSTGHYAFSPVQNGRINRAADASSRRAVDEALAFRGQGSGSIYFYNPKIATNKWITSRTQTVRIGNHIFAK